MLYDNDELTYSLDEHPETVPQAVIDMQKVIDVFDADELTGNQFAIGLTTPEKLHFVKGTSKEEKKWYDLAFNLSKKRKVLVLDSLSVYSEPFFNI